MASDANGKMTVSDTAAASQPEQPAATVVEARSVSEVSSSLDSKHALIREILRHHTEYLEHLPKHLLAYELTRAKALSNMRLTKD